MADSSSSDSEISGIPSASSIAVRFQCANQLLQLAYVLVWHLTGEAPSLSHPPSTAGSQAAPQWIGIAVWHVQDSKLAASLSAHITVKLYNTVQRVVKTLTGLCWAVLSCLLVWPLDLIPWNNEEQSISSASEEWRSLVRGSIQVQIEVVRKQEQPASEHFEWWTIFLLEMHSTIM